MPHLPIRIFFPLFMLSGVFLIGQDIDSTIHTDLKIDKKLQEVVIYSVEKRPQELLKTPSSITFLGSDQIRLYRLWDINNLNGIAPNFSLAHSGDNRNVAGIRGIVTTSYDQTVATYIDGVAQFNLDTYIPQLNDVENIEILRGPQGTFYGRNSMGGVINITTKKPTNEPSLHADLTIGNVNQKRVSMQVKKPLIKNKLFFSGAFLHDSRNGYYTNDFTNSTYDKQKQNNIIIQLKYFIQKKWSLLVDLKNYRGLNFGAFPLNGDYKTALIKPFHLSQNQITAMHDYTNNASLFLQHKGNKVTFSFQTSFQNNYRYYDNTLDADFSAFEIIGVFNNYGRSFNNVKTFINEIKFQSANPNKNKFNWTAGFYQFINSSPTKQATAFGNDAGMIGMPDKNFSIISYNHSKNSGLAGYIHSTYQVNEKFSLQAGARVDQEQRALSVKSEYEKQPYPLFTLLHDTTGKKGYFAFSPKLGMHFTINNQQFLYATYCRGFRSGGLSTVSSDPSQVPLSIFQPEYSSMFEIGFKGINKSKTIQYAMSVFYNHVTNIQTPFLILPQAITITKNAGSLISHGTELEITAKPIKGLTLQYHAGVTNATYQRFTTVIDGKQIELHHKKQIFTPNITQFLTTTYQKQMGQKQLWINVQYVYSGSQFFDLVNLIEQKAYGLIHAQVGINVSKMKIYLWSRNISNKKYFSYAYNFGAVHLGNPRTLGIGISYKIL